MKKSLPFLMLFLLILSFVGCDCTKCGCDKKGKPQKTQIKKHYVSFDSPEKLEAYLRWTPGKKPIIAAHRGGRDISGYPENCLETFDYVQKYAPCMIECDVRKTKDGVLVLMHDRTLDRTTNGKGRVIDHTFAELSKLNLKDDDGKVTKFKIPTLKQAFQWAKGKAILELDVKRPVTPEEIVDVIKKHKAESYSIVITYNVDAAVRYHKLHPGIMISASAGSLEAIKRLLTKGINPKKLIGFVGVREARKEVYEELHKHGIMAILGTLGNLDRRAGKKGAKLYIQFLEKGANILATDNVELATQGMHMYLKKKKK